MRRSETCSRTAGFFLAPEIEDECMQQHFVDMDDCSAIWAWGTRRWGLCKEQASMRLSRCLPEKERSTNETTAKTSCGVACL